MSVTVAVIMVIHEKDDVDWLDDAMQSIVDQDYGFLP